MRPEVFLPPGNALLPVGHRPLPGPLDGGCFVRSAVAAPQRLLATWDGQPLSAAQQQYLWRAVSDGFKRSSGFDVLQDSAARIGNIEWFRWGPWYDAMGTPYVECNTIKTASARATASQVLLSGQAAIPLGTAVLVRCRLVNDHEAALDQARVLTWDGTDQTLDFQAAQPLTGIGVSIAVQNEAGGFDLQYEQHHVLCLQMLITASMIGPQFITDPPTLLTVAVKADARNKPRVEKYRRFSRGTSNETMNIGDRADDQWVEVGRAKQKAMQQLFPKSSEGRFFPNGWDHREEASGKVVFFEWLMQLLAPSKPQEIWLCDPYFGVAAVDVLGRVTNTQAKLRVLTNCQVASSDASSEPPAATAPGPDSPALAEPARATQIRRACQERALLLRGLDLRIEDLRSPLGGSGQLFHDRYVIVLDGEGGAQKGFHLSNSIQESTKSAPLLITPIPADILIEVATYVHELRNPPATARADAKQIEVKTLYPPEPASAAPATPPASSTDWLAALSVAPAFFATLYGQPVLGAVPPDQLTAHLRAAQLATADHDFVLPTAERLTAWAAQMTASAATFADWWNVVGEFAAHGHFRLNTPAEADEEERAHPIDIGDTLSDFLKPFPAVAEWLVHYLEQQVTQAAPSDASRPRDQCFLLLRADHLNVAQNVSSAGFEEIAKDVFRWLNGWAGEGFGLGSWPTYHAAKTLALMSPSRATLILGAWLGRVKQYGWNQADPEVQRIINAGSLMLLNLAFPWQVNRSQAEQAFLQSDYSELRAVGAALAFYEVRPHHASDVDVCPGLTALEQVTLPDTEKRLALAHALALLPARQADQWRQIEATEWVTIQQGHQLLAAALTSDWTGDAALLDRVVRVLSGPTYPHRAAFIQQYLLRPLVQQGAVPSAEALKTWHQAFLDKIHYRPELLVSGSADAPFKPTAPDDGELSATLLRLMLAQPEDEQQQHLQLWKKELYRMRAILRQPLASHTQPTLWQETALRFAWLYKLLEHWQEQSQLSIIREAADSLLQQLRPDQERVQHQLANYQAEALTSLWESHHSFWAQIAHF